MGQAFDHPRPTPSLFWIRRLLSRAPAQEEILSPREMEVLQLMAKSTVNKEIATELLIGESTVKTHIIHIFNKLGVMGRTEAVAEAARRGIIRL